MRIARIGTCALFGSSRGATGSVGGCWAGTKVRFGSVPGTASCARSPVAYRVCARAYCRSPGSRLPPYGSVPRQRRTRPRAW
eukprot:1130527-Rhodomonas_salina.2